MTAWFKRTQPKPQPVVSLQPRTGEETPTAFLARLKIECTPPCQDCYRPADFMVTIHLVDHCDRPAVEVFICREHVSTIGNWVQASIETRRRGRCTCCGHEVAAPHDLIEDVVKL